jgi:hypothetical protein
MSIEEERIRRAESRNRDTRAFWLMFGLSLGIAMSVLVMMIAR